MANKEDKKEKEEVKEEVYTNKQKKIMLVGASSYSTLKFGGIMTFQKGVVYELNTNIATELLKNTDFKEV